MSEPDDAADSRCPDAPGERVAAARIPDVRSGDLDGASTAAPTTLPGPAASAPRAGWRNVYALSAVSFLNDAASEMILPLLPAFVGGTLGGGALVLGLIEGVPEAIASVGKLVSGRWSDRVGRTRPFIGWGYGLSAVARPLIGAATGWWHVLLARGVDRVGKGLRTSPRDAVLTASVGAGERGRAFGWHRAADHAGALLGPLIALALLTWVGLSVRSVFFWALLPGLLSLVVVWRWVREVPPAANASGVPERPGAPGGAASSCAARAPGGLSWGALGSLRPLLPFLLPVGLLALGRAGEVLLLLRATGERSRLGVALLLWAGLHVVKTVCSVPGGILADRWGARRTVLFGWGVFIAVYVGLAFASSQTTLAALFLAYGVYAGLTEAAEKALVASLAPASARGTSFGWYHLTVGASALCANAFLGGLWDLYGASTAFGTGAALAFLAALLLAFRRVDTAPPPATMPPTCARSSAG